MFCSSTYIASILCSIAAPTRVASTQIAARGCCPLVHTVLHPEQTAAFIAANIVKHLSFRSPFFQIRRTAGLWPSVEARRWPPRWAVCVFRCCRQPRREGRGYRIRPLNASEWYGLQGHAGSLSSPRPATPVETSAPHPRDPERPGPRPGVTRITTRGPPPGLTRWEKVIKI